MANGRGTSEREGGGPRGGIERKGQKESGGIPEKVLEEEIAGTRHKLQANMEIMVQEKMQLQQEQELEEVAKLSVVRKYVAEMEARRTRPY